MAEYFDAETLIRLVEERRHLWDRSDALYNEKMARVAAWREICNELCPDFESLDEGEKDLYDKMLQSKWTNIRDSWKKRLSNPGKNAKPYVYSRLLGFLVENKQSGQTKDKEDNGSAEELDPGPSKKKLRKRLLPMRIKTEPAKKNYREEPESENDPLEDFIVFKSDPREDRVAPKEIVHVEEKTTAKESHHILFFRGLLPSLETLTDDQTLEFQGGVIQLLQDIRRKKATLQYPVVVAEIVPQTVQGCETEYS